MPNAVLDTVYQTVISKPERSGGKDLECLPSFTIQGGTLNIYISNEEAEPANSAAMILDEISPIDPAVNPSAVITGRIKWILFQTNTGTPVIETQGLIVT